MVCLEVCQLSAADADAIEYIRAWPLVVSPNNSVELCVSELGDTTVAPYLEHLST